MGSDMIWKKTKFSIKNTTSTIPIIPRKPLPCLVFDYIYKSQPQTTIPFINITYSTEEFGMLLKFHASVVDYMVSLSSLTCGTFY